MRKSSGTTVWWGLFGITGAMFGEVKRRRIGGKVGEDGSK